MKALKIIFYFINAILYLLTIALWVMLSEELTLNLCVTIVTLSLSALLLFKDRAVYAKYYESKWFKGFTAALLSGFLLFCILGVLNYLFYKHPKVFDFTQDRLNSLTPQSETVLQTLRGEVKVKVFARKEELPVYQGLLQLYRNVKSDLKIELYDVELHPDLVSAYGITKPGTMIVEMAGKSTMVTESEELALTNAMIKVARIKDPVVFNVQGHGELSPDPKKLEGMGDFLTLVQKSNVIIKNLSLNDLGAIPAEVDMLMIWGPRQAFHDQEIALIDQYLNKGGKLLVALDPDLNKDVFKNLRDLLLKRGIEIKNHLIVDKISQVNGSNGLAPLVKAFSPDHPVVQGFEGPVFFPVASPVSRTEAAIAEGRSFEILAFTSPFPGSWGETNPHEFLKGDLNYNEGVDDKGPVGVMGAYEDKKTQEKIVVLGNSTLIANRYTKFSQNQVLVTRAISWLSSDDLIGQFNLPFGKDEPIFVGSVQMAVIFYFSVIFLPLMLFALAFYFFWRRRKL